MNKVFIFCNLGMDHGNSCLNLDQQSSLLVKTLVLIKKLTITFKIVGRPMLLITLLKTQAYVMEIDFYLNMLLLVKMEICKYMELF